MLRHTFLLLCCALLPFGLSAQDDDNFYRLELGGGVGIGFGLNDVNSKFYGQSQLAAGLLARFPLNPRMAIKLGANYFKLSGSMDKINDFYTFHIHTSHKGNTRLCDRYIYVPRPLRLSLRFAPVPG